VIEWSTLIVSSPAQRWKAGAGELAHAPLHPVLHHQVLRRSDDVEEAVHGCIDQLAMRGRQLRVFDRQVIGPGQRIDRGPDDRMIDRLGHAFAEQVDGDVPPAQRFDIVVAAGDRGKARPAVGTAFFAGVKHQNSFSLIGVTPKTNGGCPRYRMNPAGVQSQAGWTSASYWR
jgi:hypothetical protein